MVELQNIAFFEAGKLGICSENYRKACNDILTCKSEKDINNLINIIKNQ